jgi:hypothetical protein
MPISGSAIDWWSTALGRERHAGRRRHQDETGILVAGVIKRIQAAGDEWIIKRADRNEPLAVDRVRQAKRRKQDKEARRTLPLPRRRDRGTCRRVGHRDRPDLPPYGCARRPPGSPSAADAAAEAARVQAQVDTWPDPDAVDEPAHFTPGGELHSLAPSAAGEPDPDDPDPVVRDGGALPRDLTHDIPSGGPLSPKSVLGGDRRPPYPQPVSVSLNSDEGVPTLAGAPGRAGY